MARGAANYNNAWEMLRMAETLQAKQVAYAVLLEDLSQADIKRARAIIHDAPSVRAQEDLWQSWVSATAIEKYSLKVLTKHTHDLLPSIIVIVWSAWLRRADLSHYHRADFEKITVKMPTKVREALHKIVEQEWPHLLPPRIISIGSGR